MNFINKIFNYAQNSAKTVEKTTILFSAVLAGVAAFSKTLSDYENTKSE